MTRNKTYLLNIVPEVIASNGEKESYICIQTGGGRALFLTAIDIIVYIENLKGETPRTSEFSKLTIHKLNIETVTVFLYSRNEHMNMN